LRKSLQPPSLALRRWLPLRVALATIRLAQIADASLAAGANQHQPPSLTACRHDHVT
jgi:hypothetical protein